MNAIRIVLAVVIVAITFASGCQKPSALQKQIKSQQEQISQMRELDKKTLEMLAGITQQLQTAKADLEKKDSQIQDLKKQIADCNSQLNVPKTTAPPAGTDIRKGLEELRQLQQRAAQKAKEANTPETSK